MALFTEEAARACVRVRDGKRVFYLSTEDRLTPSARSWLEREHIPVLPAEQAKPKQYRTLFGAVLTEKPEHMTHLYPDVLVAKDHPRIVFRGMIDCLEAELLLCGKTAMEEGRSSLSAKLDEMLQAVRDLIRCDVLNEPVKVRRLCGFTEDEIHIRSHQPQQYYGQPHFMPSAKDSRLLLALNRLRTEVRRTELAAFTAFRTVDGNVEREDIVRTLNRMSSLVWIWMICLKKEEIHGS